MLPTTREIAMQIALVHELYPDYTISKIADHLMYSAVFMINALEEGEKIGLFTRIKDEDKLVTALPLHYPTIMGSEFGRENMRLQNEILRIVASANADKNDVENGTLQAWCLGIKPSEVELAIHLLQKIDFIHSYELANPLEKETKYKFYTLVINKDKKWGSKQFTVEHAERVKTKKNKKK